MHSYSLHHLDAIIQIKYDFMWHFSGIYRHLEVALKIHIWELLRRLLFFFSLQWIIRSDFNEILKPSEKLGRLPKNLKMMSNFQFVL